MSERRPIRHPVHYGDTPPAMPESGGRLAVALVSPAAESLALSTLGWQVVYGLLSASPHLAVHRFFGENPSDAPVSKDSGLPLSEFPLIAFSLNFEEDLLTCARMLDAAGIFLRRRARPDWPLVLVGGPLVWLNPAPVSPMADLVFVGEAEAGMLELAEECWRAVYGGESKSDFLERVKARPGVYVPERSPTPVRRAVALGDRDGGDRLLAEPARSCFVSPRAEFRDMLLVEVNRGCPYGCRFCAAGYVYRPARHASLERLKEIVERAAPRKVGLVGTALTDWPGLEPFLRWLRERGVGFSLSSVRADGVTREFLAFLRASGLRTLTFALEAPSRRLRTAANKKLEEADLLAAIRRSAELGVNHVKLYLIVGWPGETDEDYAELAELAGRIDAARRQGRGKRSKGLERITLSISPLVPKPATPMQWAPMADEKMLERRVAQVREAVKPYRGMKASADSVFSARLQALLDRGGEEVFELVELAMEHGGWRKALKVWQRDPWPELERERGRDEPFPWDVLDLGLGRDYLWRQWRNYVECVASPACPAEGCAGCRACGLFGWMQEDFPPAADGGAD